MSTSKIKTLVLLGLAGAWALRGQKRKQAKIAEIQASDHALASLVGGFPQDGAPQKVPAAEEVIEGRKPIAID